MRVVITGAASGIGRAVAERLVAGTVIPGAHRMLLVDRDAEGLARASEALGGAPTAIVDLAQADCGTRIADAAKQALGGVDALASNAGFIRAGSLTTISAEEFDLSFAINTRATWLLAQALYPMMKEAGGGSIVATASISASQPTPPLGAYAASKAALLMIARQLANQWGPDGIRVNTVSPGPTLTAMTSSGYADAERRAAREATIPTRRLGAPEDVADAILFLLGPNSRQINGVDLLVDGGISTTLMTATGAGSGQKGS